MTCKRHGGNDGSVMCKFCDAETISGVTDQPKISAEALLQAIAECESRWCDVDPGPDFRRAQDIAQTIFSEFRTIKARARELTATQLAAAGDAVRPIERDEDFDRTYIPLPGGWEVHTKGCGSSFRIAVPDNFRLLIEDRPYLHETLERMARDVHAACLAAEQDVRALDVYTYEPIRAELAKAIIKFPTWPTDPLHAVAVVGEEFGELTKAILQHTYEPHKSTLADVREEAIQCAAMTVRFIASLDLYIYERGKQHEQKCATELEAALANPPQSAGAGDGVEGEGV